MVETEKRGDRLNAIGDVATEKNAALTRNVAGQQDVWVVEIPGEERSFGDLSETDPVGAIVSRVSVVSPFGIVELPHAPFYDHIGVGTLPEIDARLVERRAP